MKTTKVSGLIKESEDIDLGPEAGPNQKLEELRGIALKILERKEAAALNCRADALQVADFHAGDARLQRSRAAAIKAGKWGKKALRALINQGPSGVPALCDRLASRGE